MKNIFKMNDGLFKALIDAHVNHEITPLSLEGGVGLTLNEKYG